MTRIAQPATTFKSEVGGYSPISVSRLDSADSIRIAAINGENPAKYSPMFSCTIESVFSTTHSAIRCRLLFEFAVIPCAIKRHSPNAESRIAQVLTWDSVIGSS